jgi:hypothetical protein
VKKTSKDLDKFYTHPDVAKKFVETINKLAPLGAFDMVIEPSAGSGNILQYLPDNSIGFDLHPEGDGIIKQDFFKYQSPYDPLFNNISIACVGNPPFGKGYMNPLAKGFFNHAASFSELIAFIVPAKWHTSWKVHKQLDKSFGLYFSEILPKHSFVFEGKPHNVNCCMQVWSKKPLGKNLRFVSAPPTTHADFELFLTCDNVAGRAKMRQQLKDKVYWDFGLKSWGKLGVCNIEDVPVDSTVHCVFHSRKPYVRQVMEQVDWNSYVSNMGAPGIGGKSTIIDAYVRKKQEMEID